MVCKLCERGREKKKAALNLLEYMARISMKPQGNWPQSTDEKILA